VPHLAFQPNKLVNLQMLPMDEVQTSYYMRLRVADKPGVLADITRILADEQISIDAVIQKEPAEGEEQTDLIMLTHQTREKRINAAIVKMEKLPAVQGKVTRLRLEHLGN
jgi:homoserine dehydrogenase